MSLRAKTLAVLSAAWLAVPVSVAAAQDPEPVAPTEAACGGFAGTACPEGYSCVDNPNDSCDPDSGADCAGTCAPDDDSAQADAPQEKKRCDFSDPNLSYISKDPDKCAAIRFACDAGQEPFFNDCGCGCQPVAQ
jgi:hypothetical protein